MNNQQYAYNNLGQPIITNNNGAYISGQPINVVPVNTGNTGVIPGTIHTGTKYDNTGYTVGTAGTTNYSKPAANSAGFVYNNTNYITNPYP